MQGLGLPGATGFDGDPANQGLGIPGVTWGNGECWNCGEKTTDRVNAPRRVEARQEAIIRAAKK